MPSINMLLAGVAGVAIAFAGGAWLGYRYEAGQVAIAVAKAEAKVITVVQKQGVINTTVATAAQAEHDRIVYRTQTLTKEVPQFITLKADTDCTVPVGFVGLWNAAGGGMSAAPPSSAESADAPSGVALSTVAGAVVTAGGRFQDNAAELKALQDWAKQSGLMQ